LNSLRAFEVAARHLNFRLAAEELGVTQGAVAQQVRGLEAELGLKLFDRLPRSLALTETGRAYQANVRRAFELLAEATASLRPEPRHLTISVTPTFASKWLIPRLADFSAGHPDIDLRISASDRLANFQSDAVDLAVRYGRPPFGPGLTADLLFDQDLVVVASPQLLARDGHPRTAEEAVRLPLLHDAHNFWPQYLEQILGGPPTLGPRNTRFNQTSLAIEAALAGQGLALVARFFVEEDLASGRLTQVFPQSMAGGASFYLVYPRKSRQPAALAAVRDWLLTAIRTPA
jgi:LysR family glycine cleavage system transcriptional activator